MALPDELLDELLSAHLDDALSGDERARVEHMVSDSPEIARRLQQLDRQRAMFRGAALATPKLPDGFADQVVRAAVTQAGADDLRADHPLRLAANDAFVSRKPVSNWSMPRVAALVSGLAASALFAGILVHKYGEQPARIDQAIAQADVGIHSTTSDQIDSDSGATQDPAAAELGLVPGSNPSLAIASSENNLSVETPDQNQPIEKVESELVGPPTEPDVMLADAGSPSNSNSVVGTLPQDSVMELPVAAAPLNMLLVIEVKQSDNGVVGNSFDQALAAVKIETSDERLVDEKLAQAVSQQRPADRSDSDPANEKMLKGGIKRVLLLESPAKKIDLLVNRLASDRDGISGIGFTAISVELDAPLLQSIESVRSVDPTQIRHQGRSFPIVSNSDAVFTAWSDQLGDRAFAPIRNVGGEEMVSMMVSDNGPDQMANVLFIVR